MMCAVSVRYRILLDRWTPMRNLTVKTPVDKLMLALLLGGSLLGCGSSSSSPGASVGTGGSGTGPAAGTGGSVVSASTGGAGVIDPGGTVGTSTGGSSGPTPAASTGGASAPAGTGGTGPVAATGGASGPRPDAGAAGAGTPPGGATDGGTAAGSSPTEVDPGTDGDGEFHILPPYVNQPPGLTRMPGVPVGQVIGPMNFASKTTYPGRSFPIQIYVPAQYKKEVPAALMVTQDGRQWVGRFPIIYDNLIATGKAPITINLFIPASTPADRSDEYDTVSGKYGDFIMDEVLPWVKGMGYNITDDPAGRAATGNSSGGIAAFSIAWFKPDHFHRVLTSSGTFRNIGGKGGDMYPMTVMNAPMSPLRVFFSSSEGDMPGWLDANRAMFTALTAKGNHSRFIWGDSSIPHGGGAMLNGDLPFAMEWLWRGYKPAP